MPRARRAVRPEKIVSGGQTGVDRGALDAAIALGIPHGGWCPKGRKAEDGPIDVRRPPPLPRKNEDEAHPILRRNPLFGFLAPQQA